MDIVSHLLFGRALAALAPRPAVDRGVTATIVIASIAPDVDAVLMPTWDRYLLWHQRGTHALAGTMADAIVFAGVMQGALWLAGRLRRARGSPPPPASYRHLALAAWLGCLGHITLDLVSGGTIRLFAPFWTKPFGVAWMAMGDPLIAVPLLLFFLSALVWRQRRQVRRLAAATLIVLAALVGVKEVSRQFAQRVYARAAAADGGTVDAVSLESTWGSFTRWWAYDRSATRVRAWEVDARNGEARVMVSRDRRPVDAPPRIATLVEASTQFETVRHVHTLFEFTFAEARGDREVLWSDITFCGAEDCALWFGGTFDADGRPLQDVVIIGTVRQARASGRR